MQIALCDDNKAFRKEVKNKIYEYSNINSLELVVDEFTSGEELLAAIKNYDIVLLDYSMKGMNGLDAAKKLRCKNSACAIIFITAYPEFVFDSFEVNVFRFLTKPVKTDKLIKAIDDYRKILNKHYPILVNVNGEIRQINTREIVYLEASGKNCIIRLVDSSVKSNKTMAKVHSVLPSDCFYKVHRSFVVNFNFIKSYKNNVITFTNGEYAIISRNLLSAFKKNFNTYLKNNAI